MVSFVCIHVASKQYALVERELINKAKIPMQELEPQGGGGDYFRKDAVH